MTTASTDSVSRRSLVRSTALVGSALMAGNLAGYLLAIIGSHRLHPADYGLFGAMLATLLVGGIPALALQAVVARRTAAERLAPRRALADGIRTGLASVVVGVAAWPGLTVFLHVNRHGLAVLAVAVGLLPLNIIAAVQGHLQGAERFGRLAIVVTVAGLGRLVGGVIPLAFGGGAAGVMTGIAVATSLAALAAIRLLPAETADPGRSPRPAPTVDESVTRGPELLTAILSMGALLLLSSLDLLLARHVLAPGLGGRYTAGNVVAKVAFWLPQAVPLAALPRLSRHHDRARALLDAAVLTAAIAVIAIAVTVVAGGFLVRLTFGARYSSIGGIAWLFAVQGSALAGVQLLVFHDIAARRRRVVPAVLAAAGIEAIVILTTRPSAPRGVIEVAATTAVVLLAAAVADHLWRADPADETGEPPTQWAASSQLRPTPTETSSGTSNA